MKQFNIIDFAIMLEKFDKLDKNFDELDKNCDKSDDITLMIQLK
ncbi:MAG: hypothetical protein Q8889_02560 [Candidatus Phytoplasma australasiaticum]|nr:hypothetical protein [Candidatus Phytoplasma australasiaticum]